MTTAESLEIVSCCTLAEYFEKFGEIEQTLEDALAHLSEAGKSALDAEVDRLGEQAVKYPVWMRIHILSFCMIVSGKAEFAERLLDEVLEADYDDVGEYNKLSHFWQVNIAVFQDNRLGCFGVEKRLARLYAKMFQVFADSLGLGRREYIPIKERDKNLVFVFASQVLGLGHAPTKTLLDRCYVLQKYLNKKILIINTAMQSPEKGMAPFFGLRTADYVPELSCRTSLEFKGEYFRFYQSENKMPDLGEMVHILRMVKEMKPYYLVDIGGSNICADLCGMIVPEITVSTVFSKIATACGEYQIVDKELDGEDHSILGILGVKPERVKHTRFTFSFREQQHTYTRGELGLWNDKFILAIVGWRLDEEIKVEFIEMLDQVVAIDEHIGIVFIGRFANSGELLRGYKNLGKNSVCLGAQEDVLAVLECCDLYVNPKRNGGGSSVSEALYKGLPAVTLPMGDVSVAAGEAFWVSDYREMASQILRYASDCAYYSRMAQLAGKRGEQLMDSVIYFGDVMQKIEKELEKV